ncbi:MAG: helix-turn-helix domain-containing protein [Planctomycetes bacterium]|nr:helix-turn-helix domain-containing protein [Planctomycetota bacterium]
MGRDSESEVHSDRFSLTGVELINASQFARLLGISERSLYRLKNTNQLPPNITLGRSVRWRLSEIRAWIESGCAPNESSDKGADLGRGTAQ